MDATQCHDKKSQSKELDLYVGSQDFYLRVRSWLNASQKPQQDLLPVEFTFQKTASVEYLNRILNQERAVYVGIQLPGFELSPPSIASNEVDIYKVKYRSRVFDFDSTTVTAYGMIAVPKIAGLSKAPLVSYQHGTVFGKKEVPSYCFLDDDQERYDNSYETRLMVAQFAGNGYVVIAADYFGMGDSTGPEAYFIYDNYRNSCTDLYNECVAWLAESKKIMVAGLFSMGFSQGGFANVIFVRDCEEQHLPISATVGAGSMIDPFAQVMSLIFRPLEKSPYVVVAAFALMICSYETYFGFLGEILSMVKQEYRADLLKIYNRDYGPNESVFTVSKKLSKLENGKYVPDVLNLLNPKYQNPQSFANTVFGKLLVLHSLEQWYYKSPNWQYASKDDEWVSFRITDALEKYQYILNNRNVVTTKYIQDADHRGTYISAVTDAFTWFNSILYQAE